MCCCAKRKSAKLKHCGICSVTGGVFLLGFGIAFPFILNALVNSQVKDSTALKSDNQNQWRGIPGDFDIVIDRFTHVFNVTNRDDVLFAL